ncbi:MAG: NAD(P)-dependent oxidoreductase [Planctomycetota bacterium]|nr:MAG: NAD(P)-dependent oxidoreductase [Planctomycetota bacterium]
MKSEKKSVECAARRRAAVVGLGLLGLEIADRLQRHGWEVRGCDSDPQRVSCWKRRGGVAVESVGALAGERLLLVCLPTDREVDTVLDEWLAASGGGGDVLAEASSAVEPDVRSVSGLVVDCTTGDPETKRAFGERLGQYGIGYVEAAVGGSSRDLAEGQAILMVGGAPAHVKRAEPLLDVLSKRWFPMGAVGQGARMKLVFNLVLGLHRAVLAEGLTLARHSGLDVPKALEVLRAGAAYSAVMDVKGGKMVRRDYTPAAWLSQHRKDVELILRQAERCGVRLPLSELHETLLRIAEELGCGASDNAAIIEVFETLRRETPPE